MTAHYDGGTRANAEHRALMEAFAKLYEELRRLKEQNAQLQAAIAQISRPSVGSAD